MLIAFHSNQLSERGTEVALFDYAAYNEQILGNQSIILYDKSSPANVDAIVNKFSSRFDVIPYGDFSEVDHHIDRLGANLFYSLKAGNIDKVISRRVPSMIHAVFGQTLFDVHGSSYAYVSEWLSQKYSCGMVPFVPHIVVPPSARIETSLRQQFNIPNQAVVFGGYGGAESFDIGFVKQQVIPHLLDIKDDIYFLFMNFRPFISHPRVFFMPKAVDVEAKQRFIDSCDAMLHARQLGESFGLAIAEFSAQHKPVFSYRYSPDTCHHKVLRDSIILYASPYELISKILSFKKASLPNPAAGRYLAFTPDYAMERFDRFLIQPALAAAQFRLSYSICLASPRKKAASFIRALTALPKRLALHIRRLFNNNC